MYGLNALRNLKKTIYFFCFQNAGLLQKFDRFIRCKRPEFVGDKEDRSSYFVTLPPTLITSRCPILRRNPPVEPY